MVTYRPMRAARNLAPRLLSLMLSFAVTLGACGGDDDAGMPDAAGGGGMPPTITMIAWTSGAGCVAGTSGPFTITFTVTDPDTPAAMLTYSGNVPSCTPAAINANPMTVTCPNAAPYTGSVTVTDPEGNSDSVSGFTLRPCMDDSFTPP